MTPKLGENHKRAVSTTLTMFDELLVLIEKWINGQQYRSVLYEELNDIMPECRNNLKKEIIRLRNYLNTVKKELSIKKTKQSAVNDIWSRCAVFRENIMELGAKHMRRYGPVSQETSDYLNRISKELLSGIDNILEIIKISH